MNEAVVALSGGIGGAKLALGLAQIVPGDALTIIGNVGDDFEHLGLAISPDLDTLLYTLGGLNNVELGWGRRDETWTFMRVLKELGGAEWFQLGDGDLALHVERTRRLRAGEPLSAIIADVARRFGIAAAIVPASDDPVRTRVDTDEGVLDFQDYFVARRCAPKIKAVTFVGAEAARPAPALLDAIARRPPAAIVVCPSNPFVSVEPILAVPGLVAALRGTGAPIIAVSPLIGGRAVKGPTAKMMSELGLTLDAATVAARYAGLIDGFVLDAVDAPLAAQIAVSTIAVPTLMTTLDDKVALARHALAFAADLRTRRPARPS